MTHEVDFSIVITPPYRTKLLRIWLPLPQSDAGQEITGSELSTFPDEVIPRIAAEPVYGNRFAYFEFAKPEGAQIIRHKFRAKVWDLHWDVDAAAVTAVQKWPDDFAAYLRPLLQPRLAYGVGMAVFSLSIIVNAAGINLSHLRVEDLNPRNWIYQASRNGHLLYARAEKFYYDLRVVYEIESRLKQLRQQTAPEKQEQEAPKHESPAGGSTDGHSITKPQLASVRNFTMAAPWLIGRGSVSARSTSQ